MSKPAQSASSATERTVLGNRLLRRREVELKTGKSRASIYADIRAGTFPEPVSIGRNSVAWVEREIEFWVSERLAERDRATASR